MRFWKLRARNVNAVIHGMKPCDIKMQYCNNKWSKAYCVKVLNFNTYHTSMLQYAIVQYHKLWHKTIGFQNIWIWTSTIFHSSFKTLRSIIFDFNENFQFLGVNGFTSSQPPFFPHPVFLWQSFEERYVSIFMCQ